MHYNDQSSPIYQSRNLYYVNKNSEQTFRPNLSSHKEYSPFQSLDEEKFAIPRKELSSFDFQSNVISRINNNPEAFIQEFVPIKEYRQRPFAPIPSYKLNEIQIIIPQRTARFQQKNYISQYETSHFQVQQTTTPRQAIRKKKINIVSKNLTPRQQIS